MRLLANENVPRVAVDALRAEGHDVTWIRTEAPGSNDAEVLARAVAEQRILMTFDKDFGELAYRARLRCPPGVILFRTRIGSASQVAGMACAVLARRSDWSGHFAVVEESRIRMVPLPPDTGPAR